MKSAEQKAKKVPAIRFAGFDDEWVESTLGSLMEVTSVKRIHQSDWTDSGVRFLRARDIVAKAKNEIITEPLFISQEKYEEYSLLSGKVHPGDMLVTGVGTIGVPMMIDDDKPLYFKDGNIIWFKNEHIIDDRFLYHTFNSESIQSFIKESAGIGTVGTYTIDCGKKTPISLPLQRNEQQKIGSFFSNIDSLISLEQKKYDKLTQVKKSMLEKMFPKEGATVPEIRFAGFTGDWNVQKASKICSITTGKSNTQDQVDGGLYPFFIRSDEPVRSNRYLYDEEAVITIGDGNIGKVFHYVNGKFDLHQRCYKMSDFKDVLGKYFYYFFSTKFYHRAIKMTAKATVDSVRLEMISEMDIQYPENLNEQQKIGSYFSHLDSLVSLQQRKLEKLKNIKKSLLEKMFV